MIRSTGSQIALSAVGALLVGGGVAYMYPKVHVLVPIAVTAVAYAVIRVSIGVALAPDSLVTTA